MDHQFADCCKQNAAVTASLTVDFKYPIQPNTEVLLEARAIKIEGRKIFMKGSISIPEKETMVVAARATALFIIPKSNSTKEGLFWDTAPSFGRWTGLQSCECVTIGYYRDRISYRDWKNSCETSIISAQFKRPRAIDRQHLPENIPECYHGGGK